MLRNLFNVAKVEGILKHDRFWGQHTGYYIREMRIKAYAQLLESYRRSDRHHIVIILNLFFLWTTC